MKKKLGLLIALSYILVVVFSIGSQASTIQKSAISFQTENVEPSPTPFFFDPNADTGKVLLTVNCGDGGNITPNGRTIIDRGTNVTFLITPNEGYEVEKLTIAHGDEEAIEVSPLLSYKYTEVNIDNSITVNVTFKSTGNNVSGLKPVYTLDETIEFNAVGSRINFVDIPTGGSSRWKPIGYKFNKSNDITLFESDFSGKVPASVLKTGKHSLSIVFTRQIYVDGAGWFYQRTVQSSVFSLASAKKGKLKLAAVPEESLTLPFVQENYVADVKAFDFEIIENATSAPTDDQIVSPTAKSTLAPTIGSTADPIIAPTPKPDDNDKYNDKPNSSDKKDKLQNKEPGSSTPDTDDNTDFLPWLTLTLVAGLSAVLFAKKVLCNKK